MIKNMTVLLPHLEKSDDSTRVGCRPVLNGCFITVSYRCREHPAAIRARCRGASSKLRKRDSETGIHRCAIFSKECQLSSLSGWEVLVSPSPAGRLEKKPFTTWFPCWKQTIGWFITCFRGGVGLLAIRTAGGSASARQRVVVVNKQSVTGWIWMNRLCSLWWTTHNSPGPCAGCHWIICTSCCWTAT